MERRIELEEPKEEEVVPTSGEGREEGEEQRAAEVGEDTQGEEKEGEEGAEEVGADVLRALEEHVSSKRELLHTNEDDLSEDDLHDLTDQRMTVARTLSPVKKVCFFIFYYFITIFNTNVGVGSVLQGL